MNKYNHKINNLVHIFLIAPLFLYSGFKKKYNYYENIFALILSIIVFVYHLYHIIHIRYDRFINWFHSFFISPTIFFAFLLGDKFPIIFIIHIVLGFINIIYNFYKLIKK
mgnify:CR=1 FL=1